MRCVVTGGSGFVGSHLVRELLDRGHSVRLLLRPESETWRITDCLARASCIPSELGDLSTLQRELEKEHADALFHLGWASVLSSSRNGAHDLIINVNQTLRLWEVARATGCRHFIGIGSQAEYGPSAIALNEDSPKNPISGYGAAKLALGTLLHQFCRDARMRFSWMRLFSAYGPGDDERRMIPTLIRALLRAEKPALSAGEQMWDYLYVQDAARALCMVMESSASGFYNLGSGQPVRLRSIIEQVRDHIDPSLPLGFGELEPSADQPTHLEADIRLLRQSIGWSPKVSLPEGIRRTVEWYKHCSQK